MGTARTWHVVVAAAPPRIGSLAFFSKAVMDCQTPQLLTSLL
jgi:hypothetical protein